MEATSLEAELALTPRLQPGGSQATEAPQPFSTASRVKHTLNFTVALLFPNAETANPEGSRTSKKFLATAQRWRVSGYVGIPISECPLTSKKRLWPRICKCRQKEHQPV